MLKHLYRYKWIAVILLLCIFRCMAGMDAEAATIIEHGYCGEQDEVEYTLNSDGVLQFTLLAKNRMMDLVPTISSDTSLVKEIVFDGGNKTVSFKGKAFSNFVNLEKVRLKNINALYAYLFENCPSLTYFEVDGFYCFMMDILKNSPNVETMVLGGGYLYPDALTGSEKALKHLVLTKACDGSDLNKGLGSLENLKTLDVADADTWFCTFNGKLSEDDTLYNRISDGLEVTVAGKSLTEIHTDTFMLNYDTNRIKLEANVFMGFPKLKKLYLDERVKSMGKDCFKGVESLETVHVPTLLSWLNMVFSGEGNDNPLMTSPNAMLAAEDTDFTEVEVPEGVYEIPAGTFRNQKTLTSVILPASLMRIGKDAFLGCDNLKKVYIKDRDGWDRVTFDNAAANPMSIETAVLKDYEEYEPSPGKLYDTDLSWDLTENGTLILSGSSEKIKDYEKSPFIRIPVNKVVVSNSAAIKKIPAGLFAGCSGIKEVELASSVTVVGANAFAGCSGLEKVYYTDALTTIEAAAFADCTALHQFTNLDNTFLDEAGIAEEFDGVELSEKLTSIGTDAFKNDMAITEVIRFGSLQDLPETAFSGCGEIDWSEPAEEEEDPVISATQNFNATVISSVTFNNKKSRTIRLKNITNTGGRAVRITAVAAAQTGYVHCRASGKTVKITPYGKKGSTNLILTVKCGTYAKHLMVRVIVKSSAQETVNLQKIAASAVTLYTTEPAKYVSVSGVKTSLKLLNMGYKEDEEVQYYSADRRIAKPEIVNGRLLITPVKAGKTEVYVYAVAKNGYTVSNAIRIPITVKTGPKVKKISLSGKKSVKAGRTITITAKVTVAAHGNKKLSWTVSKKKYAKLTVLKGGLKIKLKGLKAGRGKTVTVTAKAKDGSKKKATFKVRIKR